jgi:hypothetical protein
MTNIDYVRLVRNNEGVIIDSFDANPEIEAMKMEIALQANIIRDLRELLKNVRQIAIEVAEKTYREKHQ